MDNKEEVLNQLNNIHSSLVDKEKFMPYNYNVLVMWGIVSAILFLTFELVTKIGIWYGISYISIILTCSFIIDIYFIKKENIKYDLEKFTKTQTFIETSYMFSVIFAIILTYIFIQSPFITYAYLSWIFLLGFADYVAGFILNNKKFIAIGLINIAVSFTLFTICMIFNVDLLDGVIKYIAVIFSSGGLIYLGFSVKKDYEVV